MMGAARNYARLACLSILMLLTGCGSDPSTETPGSSSSPILTFEAMSDEPTMVEPGTYRIPSSAWSVVDFTVTIPEGWTVQYGHVLARHADEKDEFGFYGVVIDEIFTDACHGEGVPRQVGPGVDGLVAALRKQSGLAASRPVATTLGGHPATRVDLTVPQDLDLEECRLSEAGIDGLQVWYSAPADKYLVLGPDSPASAYILEVGGRRQVFLTQHRLATSDEDLAELQSVLDSIRIES